MPAVARKDGVDLVNTVHNSIGSECKEAPTIVGTDAGSSDVFAQNTGIVRIGDIMEVHNIPGCTPHAPPLVTGSSTVFVNNRGCGRVGDTYAGTEQIITGSSTVFAGG
jgi:uncharacterized Zn-binding protein involved in type VI secretion